MARKLKIGGVLVTPERWVKRDGVLVPLGGPSFLTVTNAQKLSLPTNTPVGQVVHVIDAFVVSGGTAIDGFYVAVGTFGGKPVYYLNGVTTGFAKCTWASLGGGRWKFFDATNTEYYRSSEQVSNPWLVVTWADFQITGLIPTLTHPAVQTLAAASTAQGGMFVPDGTQDGVYTKTNAVGHAARNFFNLLGTDQSGETGISEFAPTDDVSGIIGHGAFTVGWVLFDGSSNPYVYSVADVATPDLVPNTSGPGGWKNASDDSPASITVTSVTLGELDAGITRNGETRIVYGASGGRNKYVMIADLPDEYFWESGTWGSNGGGWPSVDSNAAFPWEAEDHGNPIGERNDICSEFNWEVIG